MATSQACSSARATGRSYYLRDLVQGHIQASQQDDQAGGKQLALVVPAIPVAPVDGCGPQ